MVASPTVHSTLIPVSNNLDINQLKYRDVPIGAKSSTPLEPLTEILFIDSRVEDYQSLVAYVTAETEQTEVILLDPTLDSIEQITQVLASRKDVLEVHIVLSSSEDSLKVFSTQLKTGNEYSYSRLLQQLMEQSEDDYTLESIQAKDTSLWDAYYLCEN
jgi:hypothetical protein